MSAEKYLRVCYLRVFKSFFGKIVNGFWLFTPKKFIKKICLTGSKISLWSAYFIRNTKTHDLEPYKNIRSRRQKAEAQACILSQFSVLCHKNFFCIKQMSFIDEGACIVLYIFLAMQSKLGNVCSRFSLNSNKRIMLRTLRKKEIRSSF